LWGDSFIAAEPDEFPLFGAREIPGRKSFRRFNEVGGHDLPKSGGHCFLVKARMFMRFESEAGRANMR
jgi:hypothetical protein